jgi:hypothetical protein
MFGLAKFIGCSWSLRYPQSLSLMERGMPLQLMSETLLCLKRVKFSYESLEMEAFYDLF